MNIAWPWNCHIETDGTSSDVNFAFRFFWFPEELRCLVFAHNSPGPILFSEFLAKRSKGYPVFNFGSHKPSEYELFLVS